MGLGWDLTYYKGGCLDCKEDSFYKNTLFNGLGYCYDALLVLLLLLSILVSSYSYF